MASPGFSTPEPEKSNLMTYIAIIAAVVVIGIIAAFFFRSKPDQEAPAPPEQVTKAPANPSDQPIPQADPPTANQQTPPATPPPAEVKDKQQEKIDELSKKVQEEEKKMSEKKVEEENKKAEALKQEEEAAKLEAQKTAEAEVEQAKLEPEATPPIEEKQESLAPEVASPPPIQQQEPEPAPVSVQEAPVSQEPAPIPVQEAPKQEPETPVQSEVQEGQLVELTPDVVKPVILERINPSYPPVAAAKKVEGTVLLSVLITETGQVAEVKLIRGAGGQTGLNEAAASAVKKWKFQPAVKDGKRVKVWVTYPIVFKLQ